jgi:hypothetical protein
MLWRRVRITMSVGEFSFLDLENEHGILEHCVLEIL